MDQQIVELIKQGEGYVSEVYTCTKKYLTIGYGHRIRSPEKEILKTVSRQQAETLLSIDIQKAKKQVIQQFGQQSLSKMEPIRHAVLIDMVYNCGNLLRWFRLKQAIKKNDFDKAAIEILDSRYAKDVKNRAIRNSQIMKSGKMLTKREALELVNQTEAKVIQVHQIKQGISKTQTGYQTEF